MSDFYVNISKSSYTMKCTYFKLLFIGILPLMSAELLTRLNSTTYDMNSDYYSTSFGLLEEEIK